MDGISWLFEKNSFYWFDLMLSLSFDSIKSEVIKVERFIGWNAFEPKAPRQQLTKKMSYTIKVITEKYISQESESWK